MTSRISALTKRLVVAVASLALVAAACSNSSSDTPNTVDTGDSLAAPASTLPAGDPAPSRQFVTFEGESVSLATYVGQPVVLNFWASWCPSCVAEMSAAFRPVQLDLGNEITFIGMNIQDERDLANELLEETGVVWISAEDQTGELYLDLGGIAMPFTVFLDASGNIVEKHNGPLTEGQLRDKIETAFG
ncbi:MAG: TlpA family protein disulfide reductase [Acidimicrobiia bacterium]